MVRLDADGTAGTALAQPFEASWPSEIRNIQVQADGKIMVAGSFYVGWTGSGFRSGIARLLDNGIRDASFDPDAGLHALNDRTSLRRGYTVQQLPDGDYLVGGSFTAYDESTADYFAKINPDGSFDQTLGGALNGTVRAALLEPFGAAILAGSFDAPSSRLLRVDENLSVDSDFTASGAVTDSVQRSLYALAHAPDGSLWVGGNFYSYNGSTSRPIVRLASGVSPYDFWVAEHFTSAQIVAGEAASNFDADGDGIVNLGELALGTDPNVADASSVFGAGNLSGVSLAEDAGNQYLQMTLDKSALSGGVWYCVQVSSDLQTWSPNPAVPGDDSAFEILEDSLSRLIVRDRTPISAGSPRFARIVLKAPE